MSPASEFVVQQALSRRSHTRAPDVGQGFSIMECQTSSIARRVLPLDVVRFTGADEHRINSEVQPRSP